MKNLLLGILLFVCLAIPISTASAQNVKLYGYCEDGGKTVTTQGLVSTTKVQQSYPSCTVTVYNAGTVTPATIFSDPGGTPKSNPFTAASNGLWFFYVPPGTLYDIRLSSGGIPTPFTIGDVLAPGTGTGGGTVTSVNVSGGTTGLTTSGGPVTGAGVITLAGTLDVDNGGTGATTLTGIVKGNGTSPFTSAVAGTDYIAPGSIITSGLTQTASRILGRTTAGTGAIEEISIGSGLTFAAGVLSSTGGGTVTSINVSGGSTGLVFTGGPITTSGTITLSSGILIPANGGTGVNNGSSTITLGGSFSTSGAFTTTLTVTGNTNVTLPTSGTLVNSAVTTLSSLSSIGTITSGTWNGSTITAGFGGTGLSSLTPYAIITGGTTATGNFQQVASVGTLGQVLTSQGAGSLPTWTTIAGSGTVTNSGTLTLNKAVVGNGGVDVRATKLTITDPATTATLTIADNSTFETSGAFTTTIISTGNTAITLPTTGTLVNSAVTTLSSLASIGTITTGTWQGTAIAFANGGTGLTSAADDTVIVSNSTAWQAKTIPACTDTGGNHLNYDQATNTFSCGTSGTAASLTVGSSAVSSGTNTRVLFDNAGVLGEYPITGTTNVVMSNSPTISTPIISGAISFPDGVRQTFNPDGTNAGINVGSQAGDPSTPSNGDLWYDSTANELTARINGVSVALGGGGGVPGGSNTQVQRNAAGSFGGISGFTSDGTNVTAGDGNLRATSPFITTGIDDTNGTRIIGLNPATTPVNFVQIDNASTTTGPIITGTGSDADVYLKITNKGTYPVWVTPRLLVGTTFLTSQIGALNVGVTGASVTTLGLNHPDSFGTGDENRIDFVQAGSLLSRIANYYEGGSVWGLKLYTGTGTTLAANFTANSNLGIATATFGTSATRTLAILSGTAPTTAPADTVQLYSNDITAGDARLFIRGESGGTVSIGNEAVRSTSANGALLERRQISEAITLSTAGATTDSTIDLPANSIILSVSLRITTTIAGVDSTAFQLGDPTTATRFGSTATLTSGTTIVGLNQMQGSISTDATGPVQTSTAKVRLTLSGGADNTPSAGAVRITIHYISITAPTS